MQFKILSVALLSSAVLAAPQNEKREPQATNTAQFSSAVSQLLSLYIPTSIATALGSEIQSAASATGPVNSVVFSAFTASSVPAYLTGVPSQYQPNLASLESAISALRGVASTGIPGAPVLGTNSAGSVITTGTLDAVTTTNSGGSTLVGLTGTGTNSAGSTVTGLTKTISTGGPSGASVPSGAVVTTNSAGSTITGLAATTTNSAGSTLTSLTTTFPAPSSTGTSAGVSSSSSGSVTSTTTTGTTTASGATTTTAAPSSSSKGAGAPQAVAPGVGGILGLVAFLAAL